MPPPMPEGGKIPEAEQVPITEKGEKEFDASNEKGKWLMDKETKELGVKRA